MNNRKRMIIRTMAFYVSPHLRWEKWAYRMWRSYTVHHLVKIHRQWINGGG